MSIQNLPDYDALYNRKLLELKEERKFLLEKLDILFLKSLETNDFVLKEKVVLAKNSLRDFPLEMKSVLFSSFKELADWIPSSFNFDF